MIHCFRNFLSIQSCVCPMPPTDHPLAISKPSNTHVHLFVSFVSPIKPPLPIPLQTPSQLKQPRPRALFSEP